MNNNPIRYSLWSYRDFKEIFPVKDYQAFTDLTNKILMELMQHKGPIKVEVRFFAEEP